MTGPSARIDVHEHHIDILLTLTFRRWFVMMPFKLLDKQYPRPFPLTGLSAVHHFSKSPMSSQWLPFGERLYHNPFQSRV